MRLDSSVPKINPADGGRCGGGGLSFCSVQEGAARFLQGRAGKALIVAESGAFSAMLPAVRAPHTLSAMWEGDALPLFALPEAGCVLAAGGAEVLKAARFFAAVRGIPCALFPAEAAFDGVLSARGEVTVGGNRIRVPLAAGEVFCDPAFLRPSLFEGYARLMLARLARFEEKAVGLICRRAWGGEGYEEAFSLSEMRGELSPEEIVRRNARLRMLEEEGVPQGEGMRPEGSAYTRWQALCALYLAFFAKGRPRRYAVPDYAARAERAHVPYASLKIPSREEYAARALRLERVRGELLAELRAVTARKSAYERALRAYAPVPTGKIDLTILKILPERAEDGLCAVIRDFGLMDWEI